MLIRHSHALTNLPRKIAVSTRAVTFLSYKSLSFYSLKSLLFIIEILPADVIDDNVDEDNFTPNVLSLSLSKKRTIFSFIAAEWK